MKSETNVLEMTSPLLSDTNKDRLDKVSELKETFESQKRWYYFFFKDRHSHRKKVSTSAHSTRKHSRCGEKSIIFSILFILSDEIKKSCRSDEILQTKNYKLLPRNCEHYRFNTITFRNFKNNVDDLLAVLNSLNGTVLVTHVHLFNTVAIKELVLYLRPTYLTVTVRRLTSRSHCPIAAVTRDTIPGHLEQIKVDLDSPSTVALLENVIFHFVGKSETLRIRVSLKEMSLDTLYDRLEFCVQNLATSRRRQEIFFKLKNSINDIEYPIMRFFQSKADLSYVTSPILPHQCAGSSVHQEVLEHSKRHTYHQSRCSKSHRRPKIYSPRVFKPSRYPKLHLFHKAKRGLVVTELTRRGNCNTQINTVGMKYCPTKHAVRDFAFDFYSNDANHYDYGTLKSLRDTIEDHFSSTNVHDSYKPFENIEEQEFQLQAKQLETSELQLILDWKQRKPLPELSWRLPVTEQVEQQLELLEEAVDIQKQWITFLRKGKFILKEIPLNCVVEVFKRMDTKTFVKALRMCKEIKKIIDYGRSTFIKRVKDYLYIRHFEIKDDVDQWVASELDCRGYFLFRKILFANFKDQTETLQAVASKLAERNILCETLTLNDTALTQEMVESLRPRSITFYGEYYSGPQNYPEHMDIDLMPLNGSKLIPAVEDLAGKHFQVEIRVWELQSEQDHQLIMQAFRCCIEEIKSRRGNGRFVFSYYNTSFCVQNVNHEEILQRHDCLSYVKSTKFGQTLIFVTKVTGGVVAGIFGDYAKKFLWQFTTTMEDFEKLFIDGTMENYRILGPEDEIAFSTIRSYFSQ